MSPVIITQNYLLPSAANQRQHWAAKARQVKRQRESAAMDTRVAIGRRKLSPPITVTLTRAGSRPLDDDNLKSAFKAVRDGVADGLGYPKNDNHPDLKWRYEQVPCRRGAEYLTIAIESRER